MAEELLPKIEEYRQLTVVIAPISPETPPTKVLFRFESEKDAKDAKISFDGGSNWLPMMSAKKAIDAFIDRYPIEL